VHYIQSVRAFLLVDDLREEFPSDRVGERRAAPFGPLGTPDRGLPRRPGVLEDAALEDSNVVLQDLYTPQGGEAKGGSGGVPGTQYQTLPPQPAHARRIRWIRGRVFVLGVRQCMSSGGTEEVDTRLERNRHQVEILRECLSSIQLGVIRQRSPAERSAASSRTRFSRQSRDRILKRKARNCQNDLEMVSSPKASGSGQHGSRHRIQRWSRRRKGRLLG